MTIEKKLLGISPSGDGPTDVAEVFNTHPYHGTGSANHSIVNGIDLAGEGGLVWIKCRTNGFSHYLFDTERGVQKVISTDLDNGQSTDSTTLTSFNSNGFTVGDSNSVNISSGGAGKLVSWTFRKKKKFFDIQEFSSNSGTHGTTTHSHDLGTAPAMMIVKVIKRSNGQASGGGWFVFHKNLGSGLGAAYILLNSNAALGNLGTPAITVTDSQFTFRSQMTDHSLDHIAYLFADNSSEDAEEQMIKCGSYTGNGNANGPVVNLGWEPQFLLIKNSSYTHDWVILDAMRGVVTTGDDAFLRPNTSDVEDSDGGMELNATGFKIADSSGILNENNNTFIYMAIRAPMMKEPEAATDVFNTLAYTGGGVGPAPGFKTDFSLLGQLSGSDKLYASARLSGATTLNTTNTTAESNQGSQLPWDRMDGNWNTTINGYSYWGWQRAKGYMDVVAYIGTGSARTLPHSLGAVPEMMWVKNRSTADSWQVYVAPLGNTKYLYLNENYVAGTNISRWNNTTPTASVITVGSADAVNRNTDNHIAYLFATLAGISKCGSYTGNGSYQTISCGFSAGSRFVLIKRTNGTNPAGDWYFWDSVRGISAGNDPHLSLNTTAAQVNDDSIDPANAGFIVNQIAATNINVSSGTYIFYAIAQDNQL